MTIAQDLTPAEAEAMRQRIIEAGDWTYLDVKRLADGSFAMLIRLLFTHAICLSATPYGYGNRFCFEDRAKAREEYDKLTSEDDEPVGWVARR